MMAQRGSPKCDRTDWVWFLVSVWVLEWEMIGRESLSRSFPSAPAFVKFTGLRVTQLESISCIRYTKQCSF